MNIRGDDIMMKIMMLLNKKGDVEEIEFGGKYGKCFEHINDFLENQPEIWDDMEKKDDGYDRIIDMTISDLNEAKMKKSFLDQKHEYIACAAAFVHALHHILEYRK